MRPRLLEACGRADFVEPPRYLERLQPPLVEQLPVERRQVEGLVFASPRECRLAERAEAVVDVAHTLCGAGLIVCLDAAAGEAHVAFVPTVAVLADRHQAVGAAAAERALDGAVVALEV